MADHEHTSEEQGSDLGPEEGTDDATQSDMGLTGAQRHAGAAGRGRRHGC